MMKRQLKSARPRKPGPRASCRDIAVVPSFGRSRGAFGFGFAPESGRRITGQASAAMGQKQA
jgi:hypothetical protein